MHEIFIHEDVKTSGQEGVRESQAYSAVKFKAVFADSFTHVSDPGYFQGWFHSFLASREGVDGVGDEVSQPAAEARDYASDAFVNLRLPGLNSC